MNIQDESGRCYCQTAHHGMWPYIAFIKFRLIWSATVFWLIIELLISKLYNQERCDRHAQQLYGSVAGNSGDIFFATCFRQFMIFCAKFYFSAQMATMAIGNANPVYGRQKLSKVLFANKIQANLKWTKAISNETTHQIKINNNFSNDKIKDIANKIVKCYK